MFKIDRSHQYYLAQRAIGSGFGSILFTDCRTEEDARTCVRVTLPDTPEDGGLYSVYTRRNTYMGYGGGADYVKAMRETVVVLMIEKKEAVENLEAILSVPGVDMVQWGPSDYSMSVGKAGQRNDPGVSDARNEVFKTALSMGVPPRAEIMSSDEAKEYLDMGVRHFNIGSIFQSCIPVAKQWRRAEKSRRRRVIGVTRRVVKEQPLRAKPRRLFFSGHGGGTAPTVSCRDFGMARRSRITGHQFIPISKQCRRATRMHEDRGLILGIPPRADVIDQRAKCFARINRIEQQPFGLCGEQDGFSRLGRQHAVRRPAYAP